MFKFKSIAVAALAVVASASSFASTITLVATPDPLQYGVSFSGSAASNVFTLDFSIVPAGLIDLSATITSNFSKVGYDVTGVMFDSFAFTPLANASSPACTVGCLDAWYYTVSGLDRTVPHTITVTGTKLSPTGSFTGTVVVSNTTFTPPPVPEPETYALMLAGLGALGFLARRRNGA